MAWGNWPPREVEETGWPDHLLIDRRAPQAEGAEGGAGMDGHLTVVDGDHHDHRWRRVEREAFGVGRQRGGIEVVGIGAGRRRGFGPRGTDDDHVY